MRQGSGGQVSGGSAAATSSSRGLQECTQDRLVDIQASTEGRESGPGRMPSRISHLKPATLPLASALLHRSLMVPMQGTQVLANNRSPVFAVPAALGCVACIVDTVKSV